MAGVVDGRYQTDENVEVILDRMVEWATEYFGQSLTDDELSAIKSFYRPVARQHLLIQQQIGMVLDSAQIDHAEGQALDYLCALLNIVRREADPATGEVVFSRSNTASTNYLIPAGTIVQTKGANSVKFETTEQKSLLSGNSSVTIPVEAIEGGLESNVAANTVNTFETKPGGIESVNNPNPISGGTLRETDDELRERAKEQVADGSGATARSLLSAVQNVDEDVRSVSIKINDSSDDNTGTGGLPDHSFEMVVECPSELYDDIAKAILRKKAAGGNAHSGVYGTEITRDVELPNGQVRTVGFSTPTEQDIYVNLDVEVTPAFGGEEEIIDNIADYIGGFYSSGDPVTGDLRTGDDVLFGEVEYAIRSTEEVYDVTSLEVGQSDGTTNQSNIEVADTDIAIFKGNVSDRLTITTTEV
jgi:hypothetical protein